jgi:hypothetical protein
VKAAAQAQALRPHIERCIEAGRTSSSAIATDLNARGIATPSGKPVARDAGASGSPAPWPLRPQGSFFGREQFAGEARRARDADDHHVPVVSNRHVTTTRAMLMDMICVLSLSASRTILPQGRGVFVQHRLFITYSNCDTAEDSHALNA